MTEVRRTQPDPTDTETLAEVLAAHVRLTAMDFPFACSCDPYTQDGTRSYTAHLTEALARIVQARAGEGALREQIEAWWLAEDGVTLDHAAAQGIGRAVRLRAALTASDGTSDGPAPVPDADTADPS